MKNLIFFLCFFVCYTSITAQKIYTIKNETLELKIEVDGKIDLLWNIIDSQYRYFVRRPDGNIQELVNTKNANNKYQEEYKSTLTNLTLDATVSTEDLNLTLYSLKQFFNHYFFFLTLPPFFINPILFLTLVGSFPKDFFLSFGTGFNILSSYFF